MKRIRTIVPGLTLVAGILFAGVRVTDQSGCCTGSACCVMGAECCAK